LSGGRERGGKGIKKRLNCTVRADTGDTADTAAPEPSDYELGTREYQAHSKSDTLD
jgi:hypothetical protein